MLIGQISKMICRAHSPYSFSNPHLLLSCSLYNEQFKPVNSALQNSRNLIPLITRILQKSTPFFEGILAFLQITLAAPYSDLSEQVVKDPYCFDFLTSINQAQGKKRSMNFLKND